MTDTPKTPTVAVIDGAGQSLTAQIARVLGKLPADEIVAHRHYAHVGNPERMTPPNFWGIAPMNRAERRRMGK